MTGSVMSEPSSAATTALYISKPGRYPPVLILTSPGPPAAAAMPTLSPKVPEQTNALASQFSMM